MIRKDGSRAQLHESIILMCDADVLLNRLQWSLYFCCTQLMLIKRIHFDIITILQLVYVFKIFNGRFNWMIVNLWPLFSVLSFNTTYHQLHLLCFKPMNISKNLIQWECSDLLQIFPVLQLSINSPLISQLTIIKHTSVKLLTKDNWNGKQNQFWLYYEYLIVGCFIFLKSL